MNRVDNPTLPSPVKLSRCDNLFRGDQDLGSSLSQPDRFLAWLIPTQETLLMRHLNCCSMLEGCEKGTSVTVGHLRALTVNGIEAQTQTRQGGSYDVKRLPILLLWD